ncbi:hypothetical protein Srot_0680 [Segniliparus rotundus DSM 44985]|uniref:Uncharacterized protein n=1 Tax=Segniliparus rotundus (strain ATCC BAA-972 / CDC 1076 / CIP 108378 / DSM 44985 / JCM 13578) TaxID=640132 RepID=D6ZD98_SEGRD|nr:hypothetical protein [Segniliparus rotundus]ADG97162.1 hypothetical protein Srot_0680 [Segniliparus rotundus DSM 44985]
MEQGWELAGAKAAILGRKVTGVQIGDSTDDLVLLTDRGPVRHALSDGQCCPSVIESITGVRALLDGGPVVDVEIAQEDLSGGNGYWCDRTRITFITEDSGHARQRTVVTADNSRLGVTVMALDPHEAVFAERRFIEVAGDYQKAPWHEA